MPGMILLIKSISYLTIFLKPSPIIGGGFFSPDNHIKVMNVVFKKE